MKHNKIQLLLEGKKIGSLKAISKDPHLKVEKSYSLTNNDFLFVNLVIDSKAQPKNYAISLIDNKGKTIESFDYPILNNPRHKPLPIDGRDVVYLLMPDRFANGNVANDGVAGLLEKPNRALSGGRHGGDLEGIRKNLDYFKSISVSALWLNPVLTNDMPDHSYHGYAITDLYDVDKRLGTLEEYQKLNKEARSKGIKMIKDMVLNHIGLKHRWMTSIPDTNWVHNYSGKHLNCNFRASTLTDPYAARYDQERMQKGWFSDQMPDLNQTRQELATYLIQNTLWWITNAYLDGIRLDTYPYPNKQFLKRWNEAIQLEYPGFYVVGEVWVPTPQMEAYWLEGAKNLDGYSAKLPAVTDFALMGAFGPAVNENGGWDNGLTKVYSVLAHDYIYANPNRNLTFLDNHDIARWAHVAQNNIDKIKQGLVMLYTLRGIPQIYYGTELLWNGDGGDHGKIRLDMPGGWEGDSVNVFTGKKLSSAQLEIKQIMQTLGSLRQNCKSISSGSLKHFIPEDNMYVYVRSHGDERHLIVINGNSKPKNLSSVRYQEVFEGYTIGKSIFDQKLYQLSGDLSVPAQGYLVLKLGK